MAKYIKMNDWGIEHMIRCSKCNGMPNENDVIGWKCNSCGKAFQVKKEQLHNILVKKEANPEKSLCKCPSCGNIIDDGKESIAWKCSCGHVTVGKLHDFKEEGKIEVREDKEDVVPDVPMGNLINCPECGKEISSKAKKCVHCGYPLKRMNKNVKKLNYKLIFGICSISLVFLVISSLIYITISHQIEYNAAVKLYENGDYEQAVEYFATSNYKNSQEYLGKTVEKYVEELITNKNFTKADDYLKMISNEEIRKELEKELIYMRAMENYENGLFENAINLFEEVLEYKDASAYKRKAKTMSGMQGEWILYGGIVEVFSFTNNNKYAGIKISGWEATVYHCTDFRNTFEEVAKSYLFFEKIEEEDEEYIIFRTKAIEYKMFYQPIDPILEANIVKDSFFEELDYTHSWLHGGERETLAFKRPKDSDKVNSGTSITTIPSIGMTSEEVRNSAWGEPKKINKTTYSWGTTEQWCYANQKYVYIENGFVTAIQE